MPQRAGSTAAARARGALAAGRTALGVTPGPSGAGADRAMVETVGGDGDRVAVALRSAQPPHGAPAAGPVLAWCPTAGSRPTRR